MFSVYKTVAEMYRYIVLNKMSTLCFDVVVVLRDLRALHTWHALCLEAPWCPELQRRWVLEKFQTPLIMEGT